MNTPLYTPFNAGDELIVDEDVPGSIFKVGDIYTCVGCEEDYISDFEHSRYFGYLVGLKEVERGRVMFRASIFRLNSPRTRVDDPDSYIINEL